MNTEEVRGTDLAVGDTIVLWCGTEFDIAFIIHPRYDEATFVGKDGVWYRPSWGGATDVMSNAKDAEMREAIQVCWHAFRENRLITAQGTPRIESYEGGIAPDIRDKVIDRLGYMACCP